VQTTPTFVACLGRISERMAIRLRRLPAHKNNSGGFLGGIQGA